MITCLAVLCLLSSLWFVRNLVADGDPLPPFLHMALGTVDPNMSRLDVERMETDLYPSKLSLRMVEGYPFAFSGRRQRRSFGNTV